MSCKADKIKIKIEQNEGILWQDQRKSVKTTRGCQIMARAETSKNYDDTTQESSPKEFKGFKNIANSQDFFAFFRSKFQLLESQVENHQPYELFKTAKKETLTINLNFFKIFKNLS